MPDRYARHDHWVTEWDEAYRTAVRHAVTLALSAHGGREAAEVLERVEPRHGLWSIDLTPKRTGAAAVSIAYLKHGDEVTLSFGRTHAYLWDDDAQALGEEILGILYGVLAGRFVEAGRLEDSFAKVDDMDGDTVRLGAMHLPIPWRFRRCRTYEPYS